MKKVLLTLAKWFHVDLTEIKYVEVEKIVEVPVVEYKEKPFRWWQKGLMWAGGLALATVLAAVAVRLRRR